jgi:hypothetical protein
VAASEWAEANARNKIYQMNKQKFPEQFIGRNRFVVRNIQKNDHVPIFENWARVVTALQGKYPMRGLACLMALLLALGVLTACAEDSPADTTVDTPVAAANGADALNMSLLPPEEQHGGSLAVRVVDRDGAPVTDASVRLEGDMNHAGMIPVISEPVEHEADGVYRVPFEFTMLGDWIISVFVTTADGVEHETQIELGVREEGLVLE